ncbi:UDP-glycosyltransferase 71E1-like [Rutidosis leptorrhynchoides]|uniref:UDP-glycosyltransferase 71E1-like n=1 Tax=Rutidosis leptorrhynchoides TaxID=125765 RepID=UPI003A99057A
MTISELVFVPFPGAGHLPQSVELAKLLIHRTPHLSVTIIIMTLPFEPKHTTEYSISTSRLRFVNTPCDESAKAHIIPNTFYSALIEHHKTNVRKIIHDTIEASSVRLVGFVVDMFCVAMIDVANEFKVPTYIYFPSNSATLGQLFYLQAKRDVENYDVTEYKDSGLELPIPSYHNPLPTKVLPSVVFDKKYASKFYLDLAIRYRESKGIIVNTFQELETRGVEALLSSYHDIPPVFPVGPILNIKNPTDSNKVEIMTWLNDQPESSVVFLCFGSSGSFDEAQVKEIAIAIERSGFKLLWSLRRAPSLNGKIEGPEEPEEPEKLFPKGFLERMSSMGKVIGWAPQTAVLAHSSIGGFVSHCGWNSILESIWFGVPIAAWPIYAEQQLNAFEMVVDLGLAVEIKIDYRSGMSVSANEIENGIQKLMNDIEIKKKVKEMKEKSRLTHSKGGSSYAFVERLIDELTISE